MINFRFSFPKTITMLAHSLAILLFAFISWVEDRDPNLVMVMTMVVMSALLSKMIDLLLK